MLKSHFNALSSPRGLTSAAAIKGIKTLQKKYPDFFSNFVNLSPESPKFYFNKLLENANIKSLKDEQLKHRLIGDIFPDLWRAHTTELEQRKLTQIEEFIEFKTDITTLPDATNIYFLAVKHGKNDVALAVADKCSIDILDKRLQQYDDLPGKKSLLEGYFLGPNMDIDLIAANKQRILDFAQKHELVGKNVAKGFDLEKHITPGHLLFFRAERDNYAISKQSALEILTEAVQNQDEDLQKKIINRHIFDLSDEKVITQVKLIENKEFQDKVLEEYLKNGSGKINSLSTEQKKAITDLALIVGKEDLVKSLADAGGFALSEKLAEGATNLIDSLIKNKEISISSILYSEDLDMYLDKILKLQPNHWQNMGKSNFDQPHNDGQMRLQNSKQGKYYKHVLDCLKNNITFRDTKDEMNMAYLATDLESVKKLYKKGLVDLSDIKKANGTIVSHGETGEKSYSLASSKTKESLLTYIEKKSSNQQIIRAAEAGNLLLLEKMRVFDDPKNLEEIKDFDKILKKGIKKLLESHENDQIIDKIGKKMLEKVGLGTEEKLETFLNRGVFSEIIDKICKIFGMGKDQVKASDIYTSFKPESVPNVKTSNNTISKE